MIEWFGVTKTQGFCLNFQLHVTKFDKPNDLSIWVLHLSLLGKQLRSLTADTRVMQILADVERQIKEWKWQLLLSPWFWDQYKDLFYNQGKPNLSSSESQYNSEEQDVGRWGSGIVGNVELGSLKRQRFGDSGLLSLSLVCCKGRVSPPSILGTSVRAETVRHLWKWAETATWPSALSVWLECRYKLSLKINTVTTFYPVKCVAKRLCCRLLIVRLKVW